MANYKPYNKYKNSGIAWLGEIPEHWKVAKLRHLISLQKGKVPKEMSSDEIGLPYLSMEYLRGKQSVPNYVFPQENLIVVEENELLILWDGANAGEIMKSRKGYLSSTMAVIRISEKHFNKNFFYHFLKWLEKELKIFANGTTIPHLDSGVLIDNHYSIPDLAEQTTIANFLDYKTEKINRFITKKKQLIELLNEQKAAIINEMVTGKKVWNGNVWTAPAEVKDSGVEWLGEIPEHWEVRKLKFATKVLRGKFTPRPRNDPKYYDGEYPFIQTGNITSTGKYIETYSQTLNDLGKDVSKEFPINTVVMSIAANIADVAILNFKACFPDSVIGFYPFEETDTDFLFYQLKNLRLEFYKIAIKSTQYNLNIDRVKNVKIFLPPIQEQQQIVSHIETEIKRIDKTISTIEKEITLVEEYKTALIAEAVTGKIDVRSFTIPTAETPLAAIVEEEANYKKEIN